MQHYKNGTLFDKIYWFEAAADQPREKDIVLPKQFDANDLSPLTDIIYYWDVVYQYTDRGGNRLGPKTANLSSPVSISLIRGLYTVTTEGWGAHPHWVICGYPHTYKTKSSLLQKAERLIDM